MTGDQRNRRIQLAPVTIMFLEILAMVDRIFGAECKE